MKDMNKIALIGRGYVGQAYLNVFPDAVVYDRKHLITSRQEVNNCELAIIAVPTDLLPNVNLDMSIVEEVIAWVETPLIVIKSALMPGTVDKLKTKYNKRITVSVEMVGEGNYFMPFWKVPDPKNPLSHNFLILGGDIKDTTEVAEYFWDKMSPDINIHLLSAIEVEICKLMENTWIGLKLTFANTIYDICQAYDANYTKVLQAWGSDGRVEKMHMRVTSKKRGYKSKCLDKDIPALLKVAKDKNIESFLLEGILKANQVHFLP